MKPIGQILRTTVPELAWKMDIRDACSDLINIYYKGLESGATFQDWCRMGQSLQNLYCLKHHWPLPTDVRQQGTV